MTITDTPVVSTAVDKLRRYSSDLGALAEYLSQRPTLLAAEPYATMDRVYIFATSKEHLADLLRHVSGTIESPLAKTTDDNYFNVVKMFGDARLELCVRRDEACERVKVGERSVEREITRVVGTETIVEDVFEWRCPDSILKAAD